MNLGWLTAVDLRRLLSARHVDPSPQDSLITDPDLLGAMNHELVRAIADKHLIEFVYRIRQIRTWDTLFARATRCVLGQVAICVAFANES